MHLNAVALDACLVKCNGPDVTVFAGAESVLLANDQYAPKRWKISLERSLHLLYGGTRGNTSRLA